MRRAFSIPSILFKTLTVNLFSAAVAHPGDAAGGWVLLPTLGLAVGQVIADLAVQVSVLRWLAAGLVRVVTAVVLVIAAIRAEDDVAVAAPESKLK